jgi:hypothetical protein
MLETATLMAVKRSATLGGDPESTGWEDFASLGLDVSASKTDAPNAPPGNSAASARNSLCWLDILVSLQISRTPSTARSLTPGSHADVR